MTYVYKCSDLSGSVCTNPYWEALGGETLSMDNVSELSAAIILVWATAWVLRQVAKKLWPH